MRRVSRRHCSAAPAANVRYKSAYFQIPSARRQTKAALYVPAEARRKDTNTGRQCVPAADNGDSVMSGWRMKTPTNKGWQEVADSVDGINIIEKLKLKTTSSSTEGTVPNRSWTGKTTSSRLHWLTGSTGSRTASRLDPACWTVAGWFSRKNYNFPPVAEKIWATGFCVTNSDPS